MRVAVAEIETHLNTQIDTTINRRTSQTQLATQTGRVNVGPVSISGGTGAIVALAVLVVAATAFLWLVKSKRTVAKDAAASGKISDVLMGAIEEAGLTDKQKLKLTERAQNEGVADTLRKRLQKLRGPGKH